MQQFSTFFRTLFKSSTQPAYYNQVLRAPMSFSWKYFFAFNVLAALVTGITLMIPVGLIDIAGNIAKTVTVFPSDLVITGDQRGLNINQELPYQIPVPREWNGENQARLNFVTFTADEAIEGIDAVKELNSLIVLTSSTIYVASDEDTEEVRVYPMPEFKESFTLNRAVVDQTVQRVVDHPILKYKLYIPILLILSLTLIYPLMLLVRLVTLAVYASLVWVIVSVFMKNKKLTWSQIFQISIHTITPVILVAYALGVISLFIFQGWLYFLAFLAWTLFVINQLNSSLPSSAQPVVVARGTSRSSSVMKTNGKSVSKKRVTRSKSIRKA